MAAARAGDLVRVHYVGTLDDGRTFDSSRGAEPLEFTLGEGEVVAGFDAAVTGMKVGQKKTVKLAPEQAYGHRREDQVMTVARHMLPANLKPKPGMQLEAAAPNGGQIVLIVVEANDDSVTLDGNHPLAGKRLTFEIELVEIADAA
jgi:FKBP-type peptidyl-prolyl cis-trans isomerase 2